jgi:type II secretory pathway component PulK
VKTSFKQKLFFPSLTKLSLTLSTPEKKVKKRKIQCRFIKLIFCDRKEKLSQETRSLCYKNPEKKKNLLAKKSVKQNSDAI